MKLFFCRDEFACYEPRRMKVFLSAFCLWLVGVSGLFAPLSAGGQVSPPARELLSAVAKRLPDLEPPEPSLSPEEMDAIVALVLERPDPETFFDRYVFGLQRHAAKLLTPEQAGELEQLIDRYAPLRTRWHDERNTLRCKFNEVMWRYAAAPEAEAPGLRTELEGWMELRMEWTLREHLVHHALNAETWGLLDTEQRQHLLNGDWKTCAKLDTGHTRGNFTERIITRALGQPDRPKAFASALAEWETERGPLHQELEETEDTARRVGFAMDVNSTPLIREVTEKANSAYAKLYLAEAEAMRRLVQAGYEKPGEACAKAAAQAWGEAEKRFSEGAEELIHFLSATP